MWEYIVIGHAALTVCTTRCAWELYVTRLFYWRSIMKTIYNHMDPDHYDEEWEPAAEELADLQAEAEEEERKETAVERYIRSTEEVF